MWLDNDSNNIINHKLTSSIKTQQPTFLIGPSGCGKTTQVEHLAEQLNKQLITVHCHSQMTINDLVGRMAMNLNNEFIEGPLITAMRSGSILYLDELNLANSDIYSMLYSAMDHRRYVTNPITNEIIYAREGFTVIGSFNPDGLHTLTEPLLQRARIIRIAYLELEDEVRLVTKATGIAIEEAQMLTQAANILRSDAKLNVSSRHVINAARNLALGSESLSTCINDFYLEPFCINEPEKLAELNDLLLCKGILSNHYLDKLKYDKAL